MAVTESHTQVQNRNVQPAHLAVCPAPSRTDDPQQVAARLIEENTNWGGLNLKEGALARDIAEIGLRDGPLAADVLEAMEPMLSDGNYRQVSNAMPGAIMDARNAQLEAEGVPADQRALVLDVTQMTLDVAGIFDPTPATDGINAAISLFRGDLLGAGISAISMVPFIGDLAKAGKLGRWAQTLDGVVRMAADNPAFRRMVEPMLSKLGDAISAIPQSVMANLPDSVQSALRGARSQIDEALGAADNLAVRAAGTVQRSFGRNTMEWTTDAQGRLTGASGTFAEVFTGLARSSDEVAAQSRAAARGIDGDHGGHALPHRFVGDQGDVNLWPQNGVPDGPLRNFNGSAYKTMENELAAWVDAGGTVRFDVEFSDFVGDRPSTVGVSYAVTDANGRTVFRNEQLFDNQAGETFNRLSRAEIADIMAGSQ